MKWKGKQTEIKLRLKSSVAPVSLVIFQSHYYFSYSVLQKLHKRFREHEWASSTAIEGRAWAVLLYGLYFL